MSQVMSSKDTRSEETKRADAARAERLAEQLRANLRRRKSQSRARKAADVDPPRSDNPAPKQD